MTFLPIVERELLVAAQERDTYWLRFVAALAVIGLGLCLVLTAPSSAPAHQVGEILFSFQGELAFGFCLLTGVFLTEDSLSFEKREGTLGLLFLTDLRGFDFVLGKRVACFVQSLYALLSIFPMLGLPLLVGGVTVGIFLGGVWLLFIDAFALCWTGMLAGLCARRHPRAVFATLGRVILLHWLGLVVMFMIAVSGRSMRQETATSLIRDVVRLQHCLLRGPGAGREKATGKNFRGLAAGSPIGSRWVMAKPAPPPLRFTSVPARSLQ